MFQDRNPNSSSILFARKPADEIIIDDDVLHNDDDLVISVTGGKKYALRLILFGDPADNQTKVALTGTCTFTNLLLQQPDGDNPITAFGQSVAISGFQSSDILVGFIEVKSSGTLQLQWALNSSPGTAGVLEGSYLSAWRLS